jgi:hypothetical protein
MAGNKPKYKNVGMRVNVPAKLDVVDAFLREKFNWSLQGYLEWFVEDVLENSIDLDEEIAQALESHFDLTRESFAENYNAIRGCLGEKPVKYDPDNRIVPLAYGGTCNRCGETNAELMQVIENGESTFAGCRACLRRDGYIPRLVVI